MENSRRCMLRKRKHSHIDDTSDHKCSDVRHKPGLSDAVVNISTNSENSGSHGNSLTECSTVDTQDVIASPSSSNLTGLSDAVVNISTNSENSGSHGNSLTECSTVDTQDVIASPGSSNLTGMSHKPRSFFELPEPVMDNIYRCLPLDDLINVGDVCDLWKEFTDKSSVWKHVPLYLNDYNIGKLSKTPYIHTVTGIAANKKLYLNAMLNNLQDLRQMDVTFCSYIPTVYVQKLVKKFTNLESITLYLSAPDIIETLNVLQNCPKLKEIQFCGFNKPYFCSWKPFFDKLGNIKSLDRLDLDHISQFASSSDVLYFLELKMKQLVSLKVTIDCLRNKDILDNISTVMSKIICDSDSLEKLEFAADINELPYDIFLNFAQIENLKSLKLRLQSRTQLNLLNQVTFPSSLEFLDLLFYSISNTSKILEHVIMSCPNLKYLKASGINDEDINELEQINVLKNLHTIILEYCQCLSPKGLQHIGKCSNLRYLALNNTSVDDSVYTSLKACKYLQEIKLENCGIRPKKLVPTVISLKHLTHLHLRTCYRTNGNNKVRLSAKYLKRIFRKCKKRIEL